MPMSSYKYEEIDEMNVQISEVSEMAKDKDNLIIMGDWNAVRWILINNLNLNNEV